MSVERTSKPGVLISRETLDLLAKKLTTTQTGPRILTSKPKPGAASIPESFNGVRPFDIVGVEEVTEDQQFDYLVSPVVPGGDTWDGMTTLPVTYKARNRFERNGDNAQYQNTNVSGVLPIPIGAPVDGTWSIVDGEPMIVFTERNEPRCEE